MKKDILIPVSVGLNLAIVPLTEKSWDLYLINTNEHSLRSLIVVSEGKSDTKQSSQLRYFLEAITPKSYIKFETVYDEVAELQNTIAVTYYIGKQLYEKNFSFSISQFKEEMKIDLLGLNGYSLD